MVHFVAPGFPGSAADATVVTAPTLLVEGITAAGPVHKRFPILPERGQHNRDALTRLPP